MLSLYKTENVAANQVAAIERKLTAKLQKLI